MKLLTSITIILSIPTMMSFYGMNITLPLQNYPHAFALTIIISITLSCILAYVFTKRKFL
ncbi:CorA family divalent cation transporter [Pelotomaculum sp. FP]|uniref:CorA family divalent cation transporter n=1 Tax=Pelotomaculum sp. FP TaxID=261474 RepID=UPI00249DA217|nr:CorA family divalent cation transporter [Pelotomaculum sp. FP]